MKAWLYSPDEYRDLASALAMVGSSTTEFVLGMNAEDSGHVHAE
jgi:hypothetical protein